MQKPIKYSLAFLIIASTLFTTGASQVGEAKETLTITPSTVTQSVMSEMKIEEVKIPKIELPELEEETIKRPQIDNVPLSDSLLDFIYDACEKNDIPYTLMLAIISVESNFNPKLVSKTADYGLTQIHKPNIKPFAEAAGIDDVDPFKPEHSVLMTAHYLTYLKDYWNNEKMSEEQKYFAVVLSYNRGPSNAKSWLKNKGWNNSYVSKVTKTKNDMEQNIYKGR